MGDIIEIFDEKRKQYVEIRVASTEMQEQDYKRIEAELIRFADELAIAN